MRLLKLALVAAVLVWAAAWHQTRQLPARDAILPELLREPLQQPIQAPEFGFEYRGADYVVRPVARYEFHGLVVTHNDTKGLGDLTHDENSVDTKDLCLIWGANLEGDDYRRITFESTPTWCHWSWRGDDIAFDPHAIANNHLVTDSEALRAALDRVHVGDQVRFKGYLVNYADRRHPGAWRNSSVTRTDSGGGACEVVFFEELDVLVRNAPRAWQVRRALPWVIGTLLALMLGVAATTAPRRSEVRV